ncbi:uncharacterized protein LOC131874143 [Cryptomeria japonica]|uniref:uncharacterized protein LOC131874143 n=1 Tax=Cryptomeria japonica TaxID=3369 RepID=UPI0027DA438D|nr:uncharacterized protein LOC131874143 [Cryptomeria japonica]
MADITNVGSTQNVQVQVKSCGPLFEVKVISMVTGEEIGRENGFITPWFGRKGKILYLESIRMTRQAFTMHNTSIFGIGLLVGALAIRHGFDCNCKTAEVLAINDSPLYHSEGLPSVLSLLVRLYTRMGVKAVHEVKGSSLADIIHMLTWGGIVTRMDADIEELLTKWSYKFRPRISCN